MWAGINTTSAVLPTFIGLQELSANFITGNGQVLATPPTRINVSSPVTAFLVGQALFSGGGMTTTGYIRARRVR
jgi:hypothetical protein